ncbi:hypothetical protein GCM10010873_26460 [Cypionkella aquatica]|uniref:P68 RBP/TagC-like beta-propeller domain-containing protein n=1 Tax=Cypionkella aquatica TaxID=1756042 RepID=A0AA37U0T5_9RHOB|nr:hypothetical protein [Cypionkella aquatica]GLS87672.1 hypothetical protein GCM10010873_26460 [Cypionkella aquatica]
MIKASLIVIVCLGAVVGVGVLSGWSIPGKSLATSDSTGLGGGQVADPATDTVNGAGDQQKKDVDLSLQASAAGEPAINFAKATEESAARNRFDLTRAGDGAGRVLQGAVAIEETNALYTMQQNTAGKSMVINKFDLSGDKKQTASRFSEPSDLLGHQGLTVDYISGSPRFWTSANADVKSAADYAVRFSVTEDGARGLLIGDYQRFKLFDRAAGDGSSTPAVSLDGRYLVVKQTGSKSDTSIIRVFDLEALVNGGAGDYATGFHLSEFTIGSEILDADQPVQALASDGSYIYVVTGFGKNGIDNRIAKYSMLGDLVSAKLDFTVGNTVSLEDGTGKKNEPEGLFWMRDQGVTRLALAMSSGNADAHRARIYYLDTNKP